MGLLVFILICWGTTNVVVFGEITSPIREFFEKQPSHLGQWISDLVNCPMCFGFWVGLVMSLFFSPSVAYMNIHPFFAMWMDGFLSSGLMWIIFCVINKTGCYNE